ncbi:bifunctional ADP-dependent NAD(P)H-hydrate dehydratase/NAD(P)H-hydrate epimerase [Cellulomonas sp. RIT-PI-Y]|uniref:bifunctional ADP-dependent NAD(P)H-hydrate dehydratase/NAD(P)H-hydrate epimerase n=1 Tax=Cellulomonas sp. RIT-PI-Y TaxID=3035297 RepID=UPI0021DAB72D|nr:bifunctional ADP-dependent NAD(P)H-hydrate dehydratase/NAD(P)H-hydrate epimerase [Cellulomonas sp. RIT-PI-Y]
MIHGFTAAQIRAAEEPLLAEGRPLMQHAAFGLAGAVAGELADRRGRLSGSVVVLLVGPGNNGGDTLHAGALLARRGVRVLALCTTAAPHAEGLAALRRAGGRAVLVTDGLDPTGSADEDRRVGGEADAGGPEPIDDGRHLTTAALPDDRHRRGRHAAHPVPDLPALWAGDAAAEAATADAILDGLLGIGGRGAPRGVAAVLTTVLAQTLGDRGIDGPLVVAVDVPSGVGVDDGALPTEGSVLPADLTVTFGGVKAGLLLPPSSAVAGTVWPVDLGLGLDDEHAAVIRLDPEDVAALWPVPGPGDHKYTRGVLGVVAGTAAYPGAAVLTVSAAARAGVGMIRYQGPERVVDAVLAARPEVVHGAGRVQAWLLGPGVDPGDDEQAGRVRESLAAALAAGQPAVLDAGALAVLPDRLAPWCVLTPHAGELATLLAARGAHVDRAAVESEPLRWARRAHELTGATVLLKGATTVVVGAQGVCFTQADAPGWLATAGSGDVLAGLLGALLAGRAEEAVDDPSVVAALAAVAALVHGRAARRANPGGPVTAMAVAEALPATVAELLAAAE